MWVPAATVVPPAGVWLTSLVTTGAVDATVSGPTSPFASRRATFTPAASSSQPPALFVSVQATLAASGTASPIEPLTVPFRVKLNVPAFTGPAQRQLGLP